MPGDSQHSIEARKRFLQAGHYQPLQMLICEQMTGLLRALNEAKDNNAYNNSASDINWLDIGCGEGYYTQAMAQTGMDALIAADISKPAIVSLAKASKVAGQLWYQHDKDAQGTASTAPIYPLVTSAAHLPLRSNSVAGISSIFSPILPAAFAEVLQEDGYLIIAKPDIDHLTSVRNALFEEVRAHDSDKFLVELAPYFTLLHTHQVSTTLNLSTSALDDLLTMTPYAYRARIDKRQALLTTSQDQPFETTAKFVIYVLQKRVGSLNS